MSESPASDFVLQYTKQIGTYIDVGAYNGVLISNTLDLEHHGWRGICLEPNRNQYYTLVNNRPNAVCLPYAVSNINGEMEFLEVSGYSEMLSGLTAKYDDRHLKRLQNEVEERNQSINRYQVPVRTLSHIMNLFSIEHVNYISIDVEGSERSVLEGFNWEEHSFDLLSLEDNFNEDVGADILSKHGYKKITRIGLDNFWGRL